MRINGITTCVGELYAACLNVTLRVWKQTLDSIVVVTTPQCDATLTVCHDHGVEVVATEVFTKFGAKFNKGAALCVGYAKSDPQDWVLSFDADVMPPDDWRNSCQYLDVGYLYGVKRTDKARHAFNPYGYFQLWHVADERAWRWPIFDAHYAHAGCYDGNFMERWGKDRWRCLKFMVEHEPATRHNWFGPNQKHLMRSLPLPTIRKHCREDPGIPISTLPIEYAITEQNWRETMRRCAMAGPFGAVAKFREKLAK